MKVERLELRSRKLRLEGGVNFHIAAANDATWSIYLDGHMNTCFKLHFGGFKVYRV